MVSNLENRYLFYEHPEMLKLKRTNHFTKEISQLLMKPLLDIDYYLPNLKKLEKYNLFNTNNFSYQIKLDIDKILFDGSQEQNDNKNNKENEPLFKSKKILMDLLFRMYI